MHVKDALRRCQFGYRLLRPRAPLFVLSHMRGYTSLLCHILNESPEISGYVETHMSYRTDQDLVRLALKIFETNAGDVSGRYLLDKILFNERTIAPEILSRRDCAAIFMVRQPEASIRSTIAMGLKSGRRDWKSDPNKVTNYYVKRLNGLVEIARSGPARSIFIPAELITDSTDSALSSLTDFLELAAPLTPSYSPQSHTGKPSFGDPGQFIREGDIVRQRHSNSEIALPSGILDRASDTYGVACQELDHLSSASLFGFAGGS